MALGALTLSDGTHRPIEAANEEWRAVVGFEGRYEVSEYGQVRSLDWVVDTPGIKHWVRKGIMLSQYTTDKNYNYVRLSSKDGRRPLFAVSRLVAVAFVPNPHNKEQVNHIDLNRQNNHFSNLEWTTLQENQAHRVEFGKVVKGEELHSAKLTEEKVLEIRRLYATGEYPSRKLGRMFGIHQTNILRVIRKESWKHV